MWWMRFFGAIGKGPVGRWAGRKLEILAATDADHIYVENVRSFFNVPSAVAHIMCEEAVDKGVLVKRIGYLCPNDKNILFHLSEEVAPEEVVTCAICEQEDGRQSEFRATDLRTIDVYAVAERESIGTAL